jgi:hypothetical protein
VRVLRSCRIRRGGCWLGYGRNDRKFSGPRSRKGWRRVMNADGRVRVLSVGTTDLPQPRDKVVRRLRRRLPMHWGGGQQHERQRERGGLQHSCLHDIRVACTIFVSRNLGSRWRTPKRA